MEFPAVTDLEADDAEKMDLAVKANNFDYIILCSKTMQIDDYGWNFQLCMPED
jgi:hypothetical protein